MIGRTLLQQAVPVTFGLVAAGWLTALDEAAAAAGRVGARRLAVQFGGAAGTLSALGEAGPEVAALLAAELGLQAPTLPWHTDRLRLVELAAACPGAARVSARSPGTSRCWPSPRWPRSVRAAPAAGGRFVGHAAQAQPVAAVAVLGCTRRAPGCSPPSPRPRSRSTSGPPGPGTRSGSRWPTCSG